MFRSRRMRASCRYTGSKLADSIVMRQTVGTSHRPGPCGPRAITRESVSRAETGRNSCSTQASRGTERWARLTRANDAAQMILLQSYSAGCQRARPPAHSGPEQAAERGEIRNRIPARSL
jgi:hypothetical protein